MSRPVSESYSTSHRPGRRQAPREGNMPNIAQLQARVRMLMGLVVREKALLIGMSRPSWGSIKGSVIKGGGG